MLVHYQAITAADLAADVEALGEEPSLRCSGCELVAAQLYGGLSGKLAKGFKKLSAEQREQQVMASLTKSCQGISNIQVAQVGEKGSRDRKYGDFNELMNQGGTLSEVSIGKHGEVLVALCNRLVSESGKELVQRMSASVKRKGGRLLDFKMKENVCVEMLGACERTSNDDDDDEDDDREL